MPESQAFETNLTLPNQTPKTLINTWLLPPEKCRCEIFLKTNYFLNKLLNQIQDFNTEIYTSS